MEPLYRETFASITSRWKAIAAAVAIVAALAVVREIVSSPGYGAETVLVVTDVRLGQLGSASSVPFKEFMPEALNPAVYRDLIESPPIVGAVLAELAEEGHFGNASPPSLRDFRASLQARVTEVDRTTRPITYSPTITLRAEADTADNAQTIVRVWERHALKASQRAAAMALSGMTDMLGNQEERFRLALEDVWQELEALQQESDLDALREELDLLVKLQNDLVKEHALLQAELRGAEDGLEALLAALEEEEPIFDLFKAPTTTAVFIARELEGSQLGAGGAIEDQGMLTQEVNQVYWEQKGEALALRQTAASTRAQLTALSGELESLRSRQRAVQAELAAHRRQETRLKTEEQIKNTVYEQVAASRDMVTAAHDIATGGAAESVAALGLNRLTEEIYPQEMTGFLGRRGRVMTAALLALVFGVGACAAVDVGWPRLKEYSR